MKVLNSILIAAAFTAAPSMLADDYQWLSFRLTDDSVVAVAAEELEINYESGILHLTSANGNSTLPVEEIRSMQFSSDASGISEVDFDLNVPAEYFTVTGVAVGTFDTLSDARRSLPAGIYVVRSGERSWKLII